MLVIKRPKRLLCAVPFLISIVTVFVTLTVTATATAQSGLVAAYSFSQGSGTTVSDNSGNNLAGMIVGATWTTAGKYGNALSFNGTSSYVDLGNPAALQLTGSMTLEAWVNAAADPTDDGQIIAKSDGAGWQFKTSPDTGPHTFGVGVSGSSSTLTQRYSATTRSLSTWYHVAGVYNASAGTLDIYVNGASNNSTQVGTIPVSQFNQSVNANIGRRTGGYYFNGVIDEVRIYNRALSQAEIQTDMNTPIGSSSLPVAPSITSQPVSRTITAGQTATFSVAASGTAPMTYLWRKNNAAIRDDATSSSYTTPAATTSDNGAQFTVTVGNSAGYVTSSAATLTVTTAAVAPTITSQPVSKTVTAGQTATFSVAASGTTPMTYLWRKNNAAIRDDATSSSYTTPAATTSDNGAQYSVTVGNSAGYVTSSTATLTVTGAAGQVNTSSSSLSFGSINLGSSGSLSATLTNSGSSSITILGISVSGAGFTPSGVSSGLILNGGSTATLNVVFAPAATGSVTGSVTITSTASNPTLTINLSGTGVQSTPHTVTLNWSPSTSTVSGYYVYRTTVSGGPYTLLNSSLVIGTQFIDPTVQSSRTYYYVVTAVNSSNVQSSYSNQSSATIP